MFVLDAGVVSELRKEANVGRDNFHFTVQVPMHVG